MGRGVVGVSAKDGKFLWGYNRVVNRTANIPTPLVHEDYVFCSTGYQAGALLKLEADGQGVKADEVYFLDGKEFQNHHGGMIMLGDFVYAGHGHNAGHPTCVEWKSGKTRWRHNRGPGTGSAAVAYADGHLYFRFENGVMALIEATPDEYHERGQFKIPDVQQPSWSHPVIAGGKLYLREQDSAVLLRREEVKRAGRSSVQSDECRRSRPLKRVPPENRDRFCNCHGFLILRFGCVTLTPMLACGLLRTKGGGSLSHASSDGSRTTRTLATASRVAIFCKSAHSGPSACRWPIWSPPRLRGPWPRITMNVP